MSEEIENTNVVTDSNESVETEPQANENQTPEENAVPQFVKIGTEIHQTARYLNDSERVEMSRQAATIQQQISDKEAVRAALFQQYVRDIAEKDAELSTLRASVVEKSRIAVTGQFVESQLCDVYECSAQSEIVLVASGADPNVASNIIARREIVVSENTETPEE